MLDKPISCSSGVALIRRMAGIIRQRLQLMGLLCAIAVVAFPGVLEANHSPAAPSPEEWVRRFKVPSAHDPWRIDCMIKGYHVKLDLPGELSKVDALPAEIRDVVRQRMGFREKNLEILRDALHGIGTLSGKARLSLLPEYRQDLAHVVLSLFPEKTARNPLWRHEPILMALPEYTKVDLFVPEPLVQEVRRRLAEINMSRRVEIHKVGLWASIEHGEQIAHNTTRWARDLMEVVTDEHGNSYAVLPLAHSQSEDLARPDNDYLQGLDGRGMRVIRAPLFFRSGNIAVGETGSKRILFVGSQGLADNDSNFYNAFFYIPPRQAVLGLLKAVSGVDEVVVLPNSEHLFHIDMAAAFIDKGVAAVLNLVDSGSVAANDYLVIQETRRQLENLGFRLVNVPTTPERIVMFQSPVNIVAFRPKGGEQVQALLPEFPDKFVASGSARPIADEAAGGSLLYVGAASTPKGGWHGINGLVDEAYLAAGLRVIRVEDRFYPVHGNTHCALMGMK